MSSTEFKNRVYGCVVVKAINANYNADFSGLPRRLKSDGSFYATDKSFKWLVRNYVKKNYENEKVLFTKQYDENFSVLTLKQAYSKLEEKENTLKTLVECLDVRLFGATLADAGNNLSLHGIVQVNHATDLYKKGRVYTDEILSPFATKEGDGNNTIGNMSKTTEAHYIHNFSVNPKNLSSWKDVLKNDTLKLLSQNDMAILKNAFNNSATFYDSHSKAGIENELSIYVTLEESSTLTLPSFAQFITFEKDKDGNNSFYITKLISYLDKYKEQIKSIELYYIEELLNVINTSDKLKAKIEKCDLLQVN